MPMDESIYLQDEYIGRLSFNFAGGLSNSRFMQLNVLSGSVYFQQSSTSKEDSTDSSIQV